MRDRFSLLPQVRHSIAAPLAGVTLLLGLSGCRNDCQKLCQEMADYAEEDCGQEFPKEEVNTCMDTFAKSELKDGDEEVCADITPTLREEWTCDDIKAYFSEASSGADGTSGDTGT